MLPGIALAQGAVTDAQSLFNLVQGIVNALLPIIVGFAILFFFYGLVRYILRQNDETARIEARSVMIWGVVIIFVMVSVWGLVNILEGTLGLVDNPSDVPVAPPVRTI